MSKGYENFNNSETSFRKSTLIQERIGLVSSHMYKQFLDYQHATMNSTEIFVEEMKRMKLPVSRQVQKMSRGEFLKFQMAFAMAHGTKLYLLDEVTAGMDPVYRKDFFRILKQLLVEEDVAILMSTHIADEVVKHMDYVVELNNGELVSFQMVGDSVS